jgi:ankyrin repeat protein
MRNLAHRSNSLFTKFIRTESLTPLPGARVDLNDRNGATSLHKAAHSGSVDCIRYLLTKVLIYSYPFRYLFVYRIPV